MQDIFPTVEHGLKPLGSRVLVQLRLPRNRTRGGIILADTTRESDKHTTQIAKVIAIGPVAFRNRDSLDAWPEGSWVAPGELVRVPKHGGDRFEVKLPGSQDEKVVFAIFNDLDLVAAVTVDPDALEAYL